MDSISNQALANMVDYTDPAEMEKELIKMEGYYDSFTRAMLVCFTTGEAK
jgi:hypothetical protein